MMRRPVSLWRGLAALLALLTPLAQQRPALLDGLPMAHGMAIHASVAEAPASDAATTHAAVSHAAPAPGPDCHASGDSGPTAPGALWCCELATVPVVVSPWLAATVATAPLVHTRHVSVAMVPFGTSRPSQNRLPFATAPPPTFS
jgi:hypothetical protein